VRQKLRRLGQWHGRAEQIALRNHAAHVDQFLALGLRLDAFRNDTDTKARCDVHPPPHEDFGY
jgi:hypothetical protein